MKDVSISNELSFNKDVKLLTVGKTNTYFNYLKNNPNSTYYAVVWCTSAWQSELPNGMEVDIPC